MKLVSAPLFLGLLLDGFIGRKMPPIAASLVFPVAYTAVDCLLAYSPIGTVYALANTQATFLPLVQTASLFGIWSISFLIAWFAPIILLCIDQLRQKSGLGHAALLYITIFVLALCYGSVRHSLFRPSSDTVKVGSVTAAHPMDAWSLTDEGTKPERASEIKSIFGEVNKKLFTSSMQCVKAGAKIVFTSEGNFVCYEDDYQTLMERAAGFAKEHQVYFMPGILVLQYGKESNQNLACMFSPDGELLFSYEKTYSWYPSTSDGIIHTIVTPFGRISAVICFDMDNPGFILQAKDADIILVPAMDTRYVGRYHTEAALLQGVSLGLSVVRQDSEGVSMAGDAYGSTLAYQDYFHTDNPIMLSDIPTKGVKTFYGMTGEWFSWGMYLALAALCIFGVVSQKRKA